MAVEQENRLLVYTARWAVSKGQPGDNPLSYLSTQLLSDGNTAQCKPAPIPMLFPRSLKGSVSLEDTDSEIIGSAGLLPSPSPLPHPQQLPNPQLLIRPPHQSPKA